MEPFKSLKQHYGGQGGGLRFVSPVFCQKSDYCSPQRLSDLTPCLTAEILFSAERTPF